MANLKEIRTRIASVASTKKITSAMKMVSAAKFKKAQNSVLRFRPFNDNINSILNFVINSSITNKNVYFTERRQVKKISILLITSNNSMCGAFNSNIVKHAVTTYSTLKSKYPSASIVFYSLGRKGEESLRRKGFTVAPLNHSLLDKPTVELTKDIFTALCNEFLSGEIDKVILVFNKFKNAATQIQIDEQYLPIIYKQSKGKNFSVKPIVEPNQDVLIDRLIPYFLLNQLHSAILESIAAEHGARMTAMHQATENATSLYNQLILEYNKARQAAITKEILEIVSGANALKQ